MTAPASASVSGTGRMSRTVAPLCWLAIMLEGFDVVVIGAVLPVLLKDPDIGISAAQAGVLSAAALLGMMIGGLSTGVVVAAIGPRRGLLLTGMVVTFTLLTLACAFAPDAVTLGVLRLLAGIGLGGALSVALTLVGDYAPGTRRSSAVTRMMTGYHVGAVLTALLAIWILPAFGWRAMFVVGALPVIVLAPLLLWGLPENKWRAEAVTEVASPEIRASGARTGFRAVGTLLRPPYVGPSIGLWVASFLGLVLVYGLNTWLPTIMRQVGYNLGASLVFLLVLNVGAILGMFAAGGLADRIGVPRAVVGWFLVAAVFLAALLVPLPLIATYLVTLLAGFFAFSSQVLVFAYVNMFFPDHNRASAMAWNSGIGRLGAITGPAVGGVLVGVGLVLPWGFLAFAATGALGAVATALVPNRPPEEPIRDTLAAGDEPAGRPDRSSPADV